MTDLVSKWIVKAEQDFRIIKHETSLKEDEMVRDMVCFHCQQMAEKYLKAYLISKGTEFPRTHNIEYLLAKCASSHADFSSLDSGNLTEYGVAVRYADDFFIPDPAEVTEQVDTAMAIRTTVRRLLQLTVTP